MEVISGRRVSGLNPFAEPFVPCAYRSVEDYSPEWWQLVDSCSWFRDYWLRECFPDPEAGDDFDSDLPDDVDSLFFSAFQEGNEKTLGGDGTGEEIKIWGNENKWRRSRGEAPKFYEKAPKFVNIRLSPRMIQQPK